MANKQSHEAAKWPPKVRADQCAGKVKKGAAKVEKPKRKNGNNNGGNGDGEDGA